MNEKKNGHLHDHEDFEEIKIPVPWGHISGKWWGPKLLQPIIAMHGWQDNAGTFDTLAPMIKNQGMPLLCIDLPGHGFSSHFPPGQFYYVFWDGVHVLRRIIKHFNWKNVTLMGHSLGGAISFLYAATYPNEVAKFISIDIVSPSVRNPSKSAALMGGAVDKFLQYEELTPDKVPCYEYEEMVDLVEKAHGGSINKKSSEIMVKRGMKPAEGKPGHYVFTRDPRLKVAGLAFFTMDQTETLAVRIKCEVLNIRANPGMTLDHPESYGKTLDLIETTAKKVERHTVEGTHHLHLDNPESISDIIIKFLKS